MRIVIVGLGDLGQQLADILSRWENNELVLIDSDQKTCDQLAAELDALVLCGDGTDPEILRKARLAEANALVATTGSDPLNTVIAMLGRRIGVEKIVVKLNNVSLHSACQEIGVDKIIAPRCRRLLKSLPYCTASTSSISPLRFAEGFGWSNSAPAKPRASRSHPGSSGRKPDRERAAERPDDSASPGGDAERRRYPSSACRKRSGCGKAPEVIRERVKNKTSENPISFFTGSGYEGK